MNLLEVPVDLPPTLEVLDLSYNKLDTIREEDFAKLSHLRVLQLQFNNISHIADAAFWHNPLLENLNIFNNSLRSIPHEALRPLSRLESLEMSNNLYDRATLGPIFSSFTSLKLLSMGGPLILNLSRVDFQALANTTLEKFAIKTASSLLSYEPGTLTVIHTKNLWLDVALDKQPDILPKILCDLAGKRLALLRFRNVFEFTYYTGTQDLFQGLRDIRIYQLIFYRGKFNENLLRMALLNMQESSIRGLGLLSIDFARSPNFMDDGAGSSVTSLSLDDLALWDISNPDVLRFDWRFTWFRGIRRLSIKNVNFNFVPCDAWNEMEKVEVMMLTNNRLQNSFIYNLQCIYRDTLPVLQLFNASTNELTSLAKMAALMEHWHQLRVLDFSYNQLGEVQESCEWKNNISKMVLHHNNFVHHSLGCLPTTLEYLDLSYSNLEQLDMDYFQNARRLQVLLLSGNKIKFIPSGWKSPRLQSLAVDGNAFGLLSTGSFQNMPELLWLKAGNNPYHCTCDLHAFIEETTSKGKVNITDWPAGYVCYHPEALLNTFVAKFLPGKVACDVRLVVAISVVTTACVVIVLVLLCYAFNVTWYAKATYQILRAKYRARQEGGDLSRDYIYHAFISYSHSDAEWVRDYLLPCLESSVPPYRLCIHERDFMPGRWIIDNIIENIENSKKVIFVLSRHFVNSEWCNYELYFAHQRAIGKTFQDVVLVVKEVLDPDSLPSKFCKLKKMLNTKTYLEWPQEPNRQAFFWAQLRGVLGKPMARGERQGSCGGSGRSRASVVELPLEETRTPTQPPSAERVLPLPACQQEGEQVSLGNVEDIECGQSPVQVA
ncbi:TLR21 protein, partial [Amia calva]|nr:TLR21 protein [Amia calva]